MENSSLTTAILTACSIGLTNSIIGYIICKRAFYKPLSQFVGMVLGSMAARLIIVAAIAWICIAYLKFHQLGFSLAFVISTFVFLMIEIYFFHKSYDAYKEFLKFHDERRSGGFTKL